MRITVYGRPITQGSKTRTRWGMRDSNGDTLKPWRDNVRSAALDVLEEGGTPFMGEPVIVHVTFTFARPTGHFGAGKNQKNVKASAPPYPSTRGSGDIDKLVRACLDSLADAGVFVNDCQVVEVHAGKVWVGAPMTAMDRPGAVITVTGVDVYEDGDEPDWPSMLPAFVQSQLYREAVASVALDKGDGGTQSFEGARTGRLPEPS